MLTYCGDQFIKPVNQTIIPYTLDNDVYQSLLNKTGKKYENKSVENF